MGLEQNLCRSDGGHNEAAIITQSLTKYYGKARGVIEIDLCVNKGDLFGFIGPNGAGKSTLIRTLLGLVSPTSGQAFVGGFDCVKEKKSLLEHVGYMPSEVHFYHGMKVKDALTFSANLRKKDCSKTAKLLCDRLHLDASRKVDDLSLGNRKKLSIVCAMQHKPSIYILDEPTSGLDPLIQKEFFELLEECHREGATIMLSSHVLSEVQRYCKHAAIIREGKIIAKGSVEELSSGSSRRVHISGITSFPSIEGVRNLVVQGEDIDFLYQGDMKQLVSVLNSLDFSDVMIEEPDIEEVFMHFYEQEGVL